MPTAIMSLFAHIRSDIPFLGLAGTMLTTAVLHLASSIPHPLLPVLHYWVEDIRSIPSATSHFNKLGYDVAEYTPFHHHETYKCNYPLDPLQPEPITYLNKSAHDPSPTQQPAITAGSSFPAAQDTRTATPDPGYCPFSHPPWG